jgi:hypothetical protein
MRGSIVHAENCRHHRVVLGLQELTGGRTAAKAAVAQVFADAGTSDFGLPQDEGPADEDCNSYLMSASGGLSAPLGTAVQFGTSLWTIRHAVAFVHALGSGDYGDAGHFVVDLMTEPKRENRDVRTSDQTAAVDWGAGRVLARWHPAYKGGWGGAQNKDVRYLAGQIAITRVAGRAIAIAVVFHPDVEPTIPCPTELNAAKRCPTEDPGQGGVVRPIEAVLAQLALQFAAAG